MPLPFFSRDYAMSVPWNLMLLTVGGLLYAFAIKAIALHQGFISGGVFGLSLYLYYMFKGMSPAMWYCLLNIPIFILGWTMIGRRFFLYSLYGVAVITVAAELIPLTASVHDPMLAAVVSGALCGAGSGIMLRSLGSDGGLSIISVVLHEKWGVRIGQFGFLYNVCLFSVSLYSLDVDKVLFSMVMAFVTGQVMDHFISLFNQRKMVLVISDKSDEIAREVLQGVRRGATFLYGQGAFTRHRRKVLLTVVNNYQLKRLEGAVYAIDPHAFVVIENTFNVLGTGFSKRKAY